MANVFNLRRGANDADDFFSFEYQKEPSSSDGGKKEKGRNSSQREQPAEPRPRRSYSPPPGMIEKLFRRNAERAQNGQPMLTADEMAAAEEEEGRGGKRKKVPIKSVKEHQGLIDQINAYANHELFQKDIARSGIKIKDLYSCSVAELKELLERIRATVGGGGGVGGNLFKYGTIGICGVAEASAPRFRQDLTGYTTAVANNPQVDRLCQQIAIDMGFLSTMSPIQQLGMTLAGTAVQVAAVNKQKASQIASGVMPCGNQDVLASLIAEREARKAAAAAAAAAAEPVPAPVMEQPPPPAPPAPPVPEQQQRPEEGYRPPETCLAVPRGTATTQPPPPQEQHTPAQEMAAYRGLQPRVAMSSEELQVPPRDAIPVFYTPPPPGYVQPNQPRFDPYAWQNRIA